VHAECSDCRGGQLRVRLLAGQDAREGHGIRPAGRLTAPELVPLWEPGQTAYVCGSASFAEAASQLLMGMGVPAHDIRVERFGPSGAAA
jgi:ferredoxin-NADP reductase